ncbi:signal peptidase I [Phyllobacterium sp. OV277]|uniref:signal peptidase I n=1 Tax=Phyllobacterium sp. OV277 TaxID=1882772 RepID=UPI00088B1629|nr:signal peptidase I [Phyllobacterium sp. OV277]SDO69571.1 signal peptidase I [Phyllobacterium sp. OV277]
MSLLKPRGPVSTFLISILGDPVAGLLWIGRGRLAVLAAIILYGAVIAVCYVGIPPFSLKGLPSPIFLNIIVKAALAVGVCILATKSIPKWYSRGYSLTPVYIACSLILALVVRSFILQPFSMPSSSMAPTLVVGDHFFASKSAYGYSRYSAPLELLPIERSALSKTPERGDIVVFRMDGVDYVKRVIGLPGETVQMIDGVLNINAKSVKLEKIGTYPYGEGGAKRPVPLERETLPNGISYTILNMMDGSVGDNTKVYDVPAGHYFVMGDNRDNSADSRFGLGPVPFENIFAKAMRIFWNSEGISYSERQSLVPVKE